MLQNLSSAAVVIGALRVKNEGGKLSLELMPWKLSENPGFSWIVKNYKSQFFFIATGFKDAFVLSDFIWPFLRLYMGVIPNPKTAFIFPISCILALIFPILIKYFPKYVGKGSFPKSQIKSLVHITLN